MPPQFGQRQLLRVVGKIERVKQNHAGDFAFQGSQALFMQVIETETSLVRFQNKSERTKAIVR